MELTLPQRIVKEIRGYKQCEHLIVDGKLAQSVVDSLAIIGSIEDYDVHRQDGFKWLFCRHKEHYAGIGHKTEYGVIFQAYQSKNYTPPDVIHMDFIVLDSDNPPYIGRVEQFHNYRLDSVYDGDWSLGPNLKSLGLVSEQITIAHASIDIDDWRIFKGKSHADIIKDSPFGSCKGGKQGFLTNRGSFVNREEAYKIALRAKQIKPNNRKYLMSEEIWSDHDNGDWRYDIEQGYVRKIHG